MSYVSMPTLPLSMAKGLKKNPNFNTVFQKVAAGRGNASVSLKPYPTWDFEFDMDRITGNEALAASTVASFLGTQMACQGRKQFISIHRPARQHGQLTPTSGHAERHRGSRGAYGHSRGWNPRRNSSSRAASAVLRGM